jgi:hypothetical protein
MTTPAFSELLDAAERHARTALFKKRQQHLETTWFLLDGKNIRKLATPWRNDYERELAKVFMRNVVEQYHIPAYAYVSEVWYAKETPENFNSDNFVQPRDRPDRKEMIIAMATDGKNVRTKAWEIVRNWNEQITALKSQSTKGFGFGGWMISLLGQPVNFIENG